MDKDLYEALQEEAQRKHGKLSVLSPKSESVEDRKAFDRLVLALQVLRGFLWSCSSRADCSPSRRIVVRLIPL